MVGDADPAHSVVAGGGDFARTSGAMTTEKENKLIFDDLILLSVDSCGAEAQSVTVKSTGCGFDPHSSKVKYLYTFIFSFHRSGVEAKRGVQNSAEIGERSVLALGSLCPPRCVWDTAGSFFLMT